ncbi:hypothetical protein ANN_12639 [Periplaneta americana]|uniref:Uncharacterized protein n=1 Tax=Periplaneta americana TaxID=6978 RepID=A0ABQ8TJA7_PERAM|nr:hypothetical protein ANN_12639 [Periplaneta americana]
MDIRKCAELRTWKVGVVQMMKNWHMHEEEWMDHEGWWKGIQGNSWNISKDTKPVAEKSTHKTEKALSKMHEKHRKLPSIPSYWVEGKPWKKPQPGVDWSLVEKKVPSEGCTGRNDEQGKRRRYQRIDDIKRFGSYAETKRKAENRPSTCLVELCCVCKEHPAVRLMNLISAVVSLCSSAFLIVHASLPHGFFKDITLLQRPKVKCVTRKKKQKIYQKCGRFFKRPNKTFGYQEQPGQYQRVRDSLRRRAEECIAMNGRHIEHLLRTSVQISETPPKILDTFFNTLYFEKNLSASTDARGTQISSNTADVIMRKSVVSTYPSPPLIMTLLTRK